MSKIVDIKYKMASVKKELECPVCMETFVVTRLLSCMHTFCEECLRGLLKDEGDVKIIKCPSCRCVTLVGFSVDLNFITVR